jgi:hypothetical protein
MAEVYVSCVFNQSIEAVWRVLRDFNSISRWLPAVSKGDIENGLAPDQIGAIRRFYLQPGDALVRERLLALSDLEHSCSYSLLEGPLPVRNLVGEMRLFEISETAATFGTWRATFDVDEKDRQTATDQLTNLYAGGWGNLKQILDAVACPQTR